MLWAGSPAINRPGAKLGLRLAGVANLAMAAGFAWLSKRRMGECRRAAQQPLEPARPDEEGDEAWLIRGVSRKLYRCPGCHGEIEIGAEHTIVQYVAGSAAPSTITGTGAAPKSCWCRSCAS